MNLQGDLKFKALVELFFQPQRFYLSLSLNILCGSKIKAETIVAKHQT